MIYLGIRSSARKYLIDCGAKVDILDDVLADLDNGEISADEAAYLLGLESSRGCGCYRIEDALWEASA